MIYSRVRRVRQVAFILVAGLIAACSTEPLAPSEESAANATAAANATDEVAALAASESLRPDPLGACDSLAVPAGSRLALRTYAEGVQIYRWNGAAWDFVAPEATLYPNERGRGVIGTHYAGPTWTLRGGSSVKGGVLKRCTASTKSIPWLLLNVTAPAERGLFKGVTHIQRLATVGGLAPTAPGVTVGEERRVYYTAIYRFYRAR